jgi:P27 family predicted phage terminase small subunit
MVMGRPRTGTGGGRKAEPIEKKRLRGARIRNAPGALPVPEFALAVVDASSLPEPPAELDDYAAALWLMFWDAGRRHLSEKHDSALIAKLCRAMEKAEQIEAWMADDVERWFYATANGQLVTHPLVKQLAELNAQITAWLSLLGFTPSDRARLGLAEIRVANELDQFRQRKSKVVDVEEVRPV